MDVEALNEEWFLGQLESAEIDVEELVEAFGQLVEVGRSGEADEWGQMLFQKLVEGDKVSDALVVLEWLGGDRGIIGDVKASVEKLLSRDRNALKLVEPAGFGGRVPVKECFTRLRYLLSLKTGMLCYNETWGFGIIE